MNTMTDDIRVMTSGAFTAAYLDLIPRLELLTKKKLVTAATSMGREKTRSRIGCDAAKPSMWSSSRTECWLDSSRTA